MRWMAYRSSSQRTVPSCRISHSWLSAISPKAVYAIRQDITVKLLTEGVIRDPNTKDIVYNLAQQDMIALLCSIPHGLGAPKSGNPPQ